MTKKHLLLLSVASGLLMGLGWPATGGLTPLLFIGLAPLFVIEYEVTRKKANKGKSKLFPYAYITFFIFNLWTTWWVWNASAFGAIMAIICNSLFSALIFVLFHKTKNVLGASRGYIALLFYWISWEYMHHNWDLSWPWLTLGNGFAALPEWIQWYEYTGIYGGSLWILFTNIVAFYMLRAFFSGGFNQLRDVRNYVGLALAVAIPMSISYFMYYNYEEKGEVIEAVVVQPNIDPYNEKFGSMNPIDQLHRILDLARKKMTPKTQYVVAPETALANTFDEAQFQYTEEARIIREFLSEYPGVELVIGASTIVVYDENATLPWTARKSPRNNIWYDYCNTAMQVDAKGNTAFYHKSKLVPGVETMPFPGFFRHFQDLAFNLGGTTGSMGKQDDREVFFHADSTGIAPVVCYESIYGEYVSEYIQNGADLIFIITNDGWWKDTPGYKQHKMYASLRAVEMRRSIARSANTGTSCFINQKGEISHETEWWVQDVIRDEVRKNDQLTFYAKYGNYLSRTSLGFSGLLLLFAIGRFIKERDLNKRRES